MTDDDDTRLDARLRQALTTLAAPDERSTRDALEAVLERSSHHRERAARRWAAPVAAAATVAVIAGAVALGDLVTTDHEEPAPAEPAAPLHGTWHRRLPDSAAEQWAGGWTMTLEPDGVMTLSGPVGAPPAEGASYSTDRSRVRVDAYVNNVCDELPAGTYEWTATATALTLVLIDDQCSPRSDLLTGTWRSAP